MTIPGGFLRTVGLALVSFGTMVRVAPAEYTPRAPSAWTVPRSTPAAVTPAPRRRLPGRILVGSRAQRFQLREPVRLPSNPFMGTIVELREIQQAAPVHPRVRWAFTPWTHVDLGYTSLTTMTWTAEGDSDGDFRLRGVDLAAGVRLHNETPVTPYASAAVIWYRPRFERNGRWAHGFRGNERGVQAYYDWLAAGRPEWPNDGYERHLDVDPNAFGLALCGGVELQLGDRWSMEVYARHVRVSVHAHFTLQFYGELFRDYGRFVFPHDHTAAGAVLAYRF